MWILIIEDEARLAQTLKEGLEEEGYTVDVAANGRDGESQALANAYDALVVDWRLPGQDGKTVIEHVRAEGRAYPILMLTALDDVEHRVAGLDAGADDYLPKPFVFEELLARLRALLRRPPMAAQQTRITAGAVELDTRRRLVKVGGQILNLRPKEYALLEVLLREPEVAHSRSIIAERVWGDPFYVSDNAIDVTISGLRQKLDEAQDRRHASAGEARVVIETVRGVGYRLMLEPAAV